MIEYNKDPCVLVTDLIRWHGVGMFSSNQPVTWLGFGDMCYFSVIDAALADFNKNTLKNGPVWKYFTPSLVNEVELGSGILKCSGQKGKMVPLSARAHCLADVIITPRVHVCTMRRTLPVWASGGQSSLYAVCRAPRQKHCWAVKHWVTKTTCSWVVDRQTQTASAAPRQEFVPYHPGPWGLLYWLHCNTRLRHDAFYTYLETQIRTRLL